MKPKGTIFFHVIGAMPMNPGFLSSSGMAGIAADEADTTGAGRRGACRRSCSRPPGNLLPNWLGTYKRSAGHDGQRGGGHSTPCQICQAQPRSANERAKSREFPERKSPNTGRGDRYRQRTNAQSRTREMLVQPLGVAVNIARVAGHTAIAALRGTAVRELILDTATGCCIRVDLRPMRRPCCCCATLCMATELSLTAVA